MTKLMELRYKCASRIVAESGYTKKFKIVDLIRSDEEGIRLFGDLTDRSIRDYIVFGQDEEVLDEGHYIKGRSVHKNAEGKVISEWVKSDVKKELLEKKFREVIDSLKSEIKPCKPKKIKQTKRESNLINQYTITDYHLGMFAWGLESGDDWNIDIAEKTLVKWFEKAIQTTPKAKKAIFSQIGDFLHFDGLEAITPTSKHVLDADTRYQQLIRVAIRVIRKIVDLLLEKYEQVILINVEGNHDLSSSAWLKECFSLFYENEPRVLVDTNPTPYHCYQEGDLCLFYAHSHTKKMGLIDTVFVADYKDEFGKSKYVYAHIGHLHHLKVIESNLMILEQHNTLSAKDSHASRGGYRSKRNAKIITYHTKYGEVARSTISPEMLL